MTIYWRRKLTRLELAIYVVVVSVAIGIFLERALYYMEASERSAVEATVLNANSAVAVHAAESFLKGVLVQPGLNPFDLMTPPPTYLGALATPDLESLPGGSWLFDTARGQLIYLPRLRRHLQSSDPVGALRFEVRRDAIRLKLVPTNKYNWRA